MNWKILKSKLNKNISVLFYIDWTLKDSSYLKMLRIKTLLGELKNNKYVSNLSMSAIKSIRNINPYSFFFVSLQHLITAYALS